MIISGFSSYTWELRVSHPGDGEALDHRFRFRTAGITESMRSSRGFRSKKSSNFSPTFITRTRKIAWIRKPMRMRPPVTPSAINTCSAVGPSGGSRCSDMPGGKETLPSAESASAGAAAEVELWPLLSFPFGPGSFRSLEDVVNTIISVAVAVTDAVTEAVTDVIIAEALIVMVCVAVLTAGDTGVGADGKAVVLTKIGVEIAVEERRTGDGVSETEGCTGDSLVRVSEGRGTDAVVVDGTNGCCVVVVSGGTSVVDGIEGIAGLRVNSGTGTTAGPGWIGGWNSGGGTDSVGTGSGRKAVGVPWNMVTTSAANTVLFGLLFWLFLFL